MNTDNLFCLNTLLLRLHVQNVSTKNITHIRIGWDEKLRRDLLGHRVKQPSNIFYMFCAKKSANQETLVDNSVYKIIRKLNNFIPRSSAVNFFNIMHAGKLEF